MWCKRFKFFIMRYLIYTVFLILSMASYGFADVPIGSMSGNALSDIFENPQIEEKPEVEESSQIDEKPEFDEFDEFGDFVEFNDQDVMEIYDPLCGYNRFMTRVNDKMYIWFFKPVAQGYSFIVREPVRQSLAKFFNNLVFPGRFVNNLLQLKTKQAGIEAARFGMNTTIGLLGLFDPARSWLELEPCPEDFGQTLGYYGVGRGFHIVLPLLGPSNLRDTVGKLPDYFLDPVIYIDETEISLAVYGTKVVNATSLYIGQYETLKKDALDLYILLRNAYEMKRLKEIEE